MKELLKSIGTFKLALAGLFLIGLIVAAKYFPILDWIKAFGVWSQQFGFAGAVIYGIVFGVSAIFMVPCLPLTLLAGFTFGLARGLFAVVLGIAIGAAGGFLIARYLARDTVAQKVGQNARFAAIDGAIAKDGWKIVGLLRMLPVPFGVTNYLYGLTAIEFWRYMAASLVGMLPANILFVYLGAFGKRSIDGPRHPLEYVMGGLMVAALVAVIVVLRKIAQRAAGSAAV
ncbi:MAG: TVP38/TMEM64 family protein [Chthoniobacterales bacterium]|nr:TVP38/TMEM64 family protein [Chthoniobacterales bacterium]